jgi:hypothetical protein
MTTAIAKMREQLRQELAGLNKRISPPSGNNISTKGKVFSMPDGSTNPGPMAAVILDWRAVNQYYNGVYDPAKPVSPVCWAIHSEPDQQAPSAACPDQKAETCTECAMNKFGSAPTGKGKACKNTRRLAIVPADATVDTIPMILTVSPTGIKNFESYVNQLGAGENGQMPIEVATHIGFKPDAAYPTLVFGKPVSLTDEQLAVMLKLREVAQASLDREPEANS